MGEKTSVNSAKKKYHQYKQINLPNKEKMLSFHKKPNPTFSESPRLSVSLVLIVPTLKINWTPPTQ